jgi:predicted amidohydrolase
MTASTTPYPCQPLRTDDINVAVVQSIVRTIVDTQNPEKERKKNLDHMCWLVDQAIGFGKKDLVVFHEFPLSGFNFHWTREECLKVAIDVPGSETEALGQKAKQYNCYISFGAYAKLVDWPGHFINMGIIVGPSGEVIYKHWKMRNMAGMGFSTTVYDVLDPYVERYGYDAVWPIARTDIGNIAIMPCVMEPEMARAYAMKGCEIIIRYMTGGNRDIYKLDLQAQCVANDMFGIFVNQSVSSDNIYIDDAWSGGTCLYDSKGRLLETANSVHECLVPGEFPMAAYRKKHTLPKFFKELYMPLFEEWVSKYPPNSFSESLPNSIADSMGHYRKIQNW